ncbi:MULTISPECIES: autotransporter outer membrane beta-barrel domain-containing protein [unclassified Desulfovibrio]|uniref:autotransporter outer membrane beta-barrel domain-containing protein n=1 Tax=unclassified Desulfovibrio TaxID=2593640 RepID=UPI0013ECA508|nr:MULTISPECIES: autotransporter outer membrane beta-barrel domain-containing protein [unclassified Desulfovibrio]
MTFAVHASSLSRAVTRALPVLTLLLATALGAATAHAANDPNGTFRGASLTGTNTYAQVQPTGSNFTLRNGTLTLTGNNGGVLLVTNSRNPRFTLSSDSGDVTLVLQKGTFGGSIALGGNNYSSTLLVGAGATANRPTVTINGSLMGSNDGFSHVRTTGANLVITGGVGDSHYIGLLSALNGNIRLTQGSGQHQVETVRVASGNELFSQARLVIRDLDLYNGATVRGDTEIHINGVIGSTENRMRPGSLLTAGANIYFLDPHRTGEGGIREASGTIRAGANIGTYGNNYRSYDIMQGSGHLTIEAGGSIGGRTITADSISARGTIVAGTDISSPAEIRVDGPFSLTPNKTLTGTTIKAGLIAAGEVRDIAGASTPSRVEAGRMMVVADADGSTGNFTLRNGSFRITGTSAVGNAEYGAGGAIISHNEAAWVGGRLDVNNNGASSFTTVGVKGAARIGGGSLSGGSLGAASVTLHNGIDAAIDAVSVRQGNMQIGAAADTAAATRAGIANLRLNGHELLVGAGGGQAYGAVGNFVTAAGAGNLTDGAITVGHNGRLALGTGSNGALEAVTATVGMAPSSAVLGVFSPMVLGSSLAVDHAASVGAARAMGRAAAGPARAAAGPVSFSGNSLLVIDGGKSGVNYANPAVPTRALPASVPGALSAASPTQASVAPGAKIYIDHVTPGHTYVALGRNIATHYADATAWSGANLLSSNPLLELTRLGNGMEGQFSVTEKAPHTKSIGVASGVPRLSQAASESMESAIYSRIKLGQEDLYRHSFALWALPLYESIDHFGLDGGTATYGFRGGIGGLAIGGDYTWGNTLRTGLSLNMGAGYVKSTGDMATTENSATFWGVGAYGVWKPGALSFDGEVDFTSVYNKIRQDLPVDLGGSAIKADIPAWSLGMSLRAEYEIDTRYVNLRPHLGVRYLHMVSEPFDATLNGEDVLRGHRTHQNVWTMPFGLVFTKPFKLENGWEITPLVNLKAIPALGDTYAKTSVRYAGSHKDQDFESQVMDAITWGGRAGVELRAGDFSAGLNYIGQFGEHTANQGLFGVVRYEF